MDIYKILFTTPKWSYFQMDLAWKASGKKWLEMFEWEAVCMHELWRELKPPAKTRTGA